MVYGASASDGIFRSDLCDCGRLLDVNARCVDRFLLYRALSGNSSGVHVSETERVLRLVYQLGKIQHTRMVVFVLHSNHRAMGILDVATFNGKVVVDSSSSFVWFIDRRSHCVDSADTHHDGPFVSPFVI